MTARFDSLGFVQKLEEVGVERRVAETHAVLVRDYIMDEVATKGDVEQIKAEVSGATDQLRVEMRAGEERLEAKIDSLEQRMTIKLGGFLVVAVGALVALERLLV